MTDRSDVAPRERAKRFRERAFQARRDAERATGAIREGYLLLECGWHTLADDVEANAKRNERDSEGGTEPKEAARRRPKDSTD